VGVRSRWLVAVLTALVFFGGCWTGLALARVLDTGSQVGIASVPLVVVLAVLGAWAERAREKGQEAVGQGIISALAPSVLHDRRRSARWGTKGS
jgi:hypothetical protein